MISKIPPKLGVANKQGSGSFVRVRISQRPVILALGHAALLVGSSAEERRHGPVPCFFVYEEGNEMAKPWVPHCTDQTAAIQEMPAVTQLRWNRLTASERFPVALAIL